MSRFSLCLLLLVSAAASAQIFNPVAVAFSLKQGKGKNEIIAKATIERGWHFYSSDFDPNVGPIVATIQVDKGGKAIGALQSIGSTKAHDDIFDGDVAFFIGKGELRQAIALDAGATTITGELNGQACDDKGKCLPVSATFELPVAPVAQAQPAAKKEAVPVQPKLAAIDTVVDAFTGDAITAHTTDSLPTAQLAAPADTHEGVGLPPVLKVPDAMPPPANAGLWAFFWLAFGSGLLALLTPCVFPLIPMTVSFFTRSAGSRTKALGMAALYGFFIVALYVVAGVVVSRLFGADVANELATHWLPNSIFFAVFLLFGFSFLGYFEIVLPSSWATAADARADKGGVVGIFFMALTLVVVSFSCTGPIASAILLGSAGGEVAKPIVGMLGFSLAFALPFSVFAAFPQLLSSLPKSGGWLNSVKVVLGFVEIALSIKFLSVADLAYHWHLLDREIYLALWIVIFSLLGLYLLGKLRLPHDDAERGVGGWLPLTLAIAVFTFVVYLVPGLWGAPLRSLSGYIPPLETQEFRGNVVSAPTPTPNPTSNSTCTPPLYADFLHLPHGLQGYFDLAQAKACAKATGKPIFIDFTGHGCTNCREMEARVWADPRILSLLKERFIVCALYVDDRTELPKEKHYISPQDGKAKTTIGKQNLDMEVRQYGSNAQPHYVIVDADGKLLAGPHNYDLSIDRFEVFLHKGLMK